MVHHNNNVCIYVYRECSLTGGKLNNQEIVGKHAFPLNHKENTSR